MGDNCISLTAKQSTHVTFYQHISSKKHHDIIIIIIDYLSSSCLFSLTEEMIFTRVYRVISDTCEINAGDNCF